ncbi:MAG: AzlC family ABC transporter permease [Clostridiales bacterium]|nr:AzlC family ABC transporter permease [Clostridiales bacterium]
MFTERKANFFKGMKDGIPIMLGYFAVALTLGIAAKNAGMTAFQATITSLLINASAGEFIGFTLIAANAGYFEVILMEAIANARYLLMSCSLSQKLDPKTSILHRMLVGFYITDEIFGVSVSYPGKLNPYYTYGVAAVASPGWALGTLMGVILGNVLPVQIVSALSVGLYGMFISIFIPPAKQNRIIAGLVAFSFAASYIFNNLALFAGISSGMKIIILTVVISLGAAILFPVKEGGSEHDA